MVGFVHMLKGYIQRYLPSSHKVTPFFSSSLSYDLRFRFLPVVLAARGGGGGVGDATAAPHEKQNLVSSGSCAPQLQQFFIGLGC